MPSNVVWTRPRGSRSPRRPPTGRHADPALLAGMLAQLHLIRAFEETVLELAGEGLVHGPAHSSIGQEGGAVGSIIGSALERRDQRLAPRPPPVPREGAHARRRHPIRPRPPRHARHPGRAAAHARRDPRTRAGVLPRPWRLDAPAVVRGRRARHERDRGRRRAARGRQRVGAEAFRHQRPHGQLLRRRRHAHRLGAREHEPRGGLEAARRILHREQPLTVCRRTSRRSPPSPGSLSRGLGFGIPSCRVDGMDPLAVHLAMAEAARAPAHRARAPRSSRPRCTATSTRTAPTREAPSATARRRRRRSWRERDPLARVAAR